MIGVVATIKIKDGTASDFEAVATELANKVKANEPGVITYEVYKSRAEDNTYIMMEQYASEEALTAHGQTDHFKAIGAKMSQYLAGLPEIKYYDIVE